MPIATVGQHLLEITAGEHFVSCDDALTLLADKLEAVCALIVEAQQRKKRIETLSGNYKPASRMRALNKVLRRSECPTLGRISGTGR